MSETSEPLWYIKTRGGEQAINLRDSKAKSDTKRTSESGFGDSGNDDPISGELRSFGYTRVIGNKGRDDTEVDSGELLEIVWGLYQTNPLAKRIIDYTAIYTVGGGVSFSTQDEGLKIILDKFWKKNKIDQQIKKFVAQLGLWGEQFYPVFIRETDGRVMLGYIDPATVESVICHPGNALARWAIIASGVGGVKRIYRIVQEDDSFVKIDARGEVAAVTATNPDLLVVAPNSIYKKADQTTLQAWEVSLLAEMELTEYTGSCLLYQINNMSNQSRGVSDLLQVVDWLGLLDSVFFAIGEREQFAAWFYWFVEMDGADQDAVDYRAKQISDNPPGKGSVNVHNKKEQWELKIPDLKQSGSLESVLTLITFIVGAMGYPLHWFGFPDNSNRATAQSQNGPTERTLESRQSDIKFMVTEWLELARDQAQIAGEWKPTEGQDSEIVVIMPEIVEDNIAIVSTVLADFVGAFTTAESRDWIATDTIIETLSTVLKEMGINVDLSEMIDNGKGGDAEAEPTEPQDTEGEPDAESDSDSSN